MQRYYAIKIEVVEVDSDHYVRDTTELHYTSTALMHQARAEMIANMLIDEANRDFLRSAQPEARMDISAGLFN